ncbi:DUF4342 domain-containing protein [Actinokineospora sp. NPDC004072]
MNDKPDTTRSAADQVVDAVRGLLHQGMTRRVVVRDSKDDVLLDVPIAVGIVAALAAPVATTLGAGVALAGKCGIKIENRDAGAPPPATVDAEA